MRSARYQDRYQTVAEFQVDIRNFLSHRQSVGLAHLAQADWETAEQSQEYTDYSRALFGFEEAEKLWPGNSHASFGIREVKRSWALCAETKYDFDLALSLVEAVPNYQEDTGRLTLARDERNARQSRIKMLRHLLSATIMVMFLVVFLVVGAATWWINSARLRARANASLAMAHSAEATLQRQSAVTAQASTERRERETRDALSLAKRRETEARVALDLAERRAIAQCDVSSEQYQLGRACSALGRPADALEHFVRMLELEKTQSAHDPESKIGRIDLALAYFHICQTNLSLNRMVSAIDAKRQVVNIYQSIADDEASVVNRRLLLGAIF